MKKAAKICSIIITSVLTFINVYKLIPANNIISVYIEKAILFLKSISYLETCVYIVLFVLGLFVIFNMFLELRNVTTTYKLKKGSRRFYRFFAKWYSQPGILSIICDDIEWISNGKENRVLDSLIQKSHENRLNLYILKKNTPMAKKLIENGARPYNVSKNIVLNYSFSCISFMGNNSSIIVRDKSNDNKNEIKFTEVSNIYISSLLNELIKENDE